MQQPFLIIRYGLRGSWNKMLWILATMVDLLKFNIDCYEDVLFPVKHFTQKQ